MRQLAAENFERSTGLLRSWSRVGHYVDRMSQLSAVFHDGEDACYRRKIMTGGTARK
jgi:hypothetical protein